MSKRFNGVFRAKLNERRVSLPKLLLENFSSEADNRVLITSGYETNILIYPEDNWNIFATYLELGTDIQKKLLFRLGLNSTLQRIENTGRVRLAESLLKAQNIGENVVLLGDGLFISVWDEANFEKMMENEKEYDDSIDKNQLIIDKRD